ncbi:6-phospho-beta-glucosidase [Scopulibacillus darangshiensis]|uniref:6-phospho-beta-glucosidase n=1 Tax=Scopulibacillus darangshiensis TaxID=442528 RepID=A0A4R2P9T5_9BACL|nr:glycoside hydrolase family 1 protein [Scopulibacillus darangshiensis]TCP30984.1 6-phospho-beta-glucosidase [Scopulibacillus darangshiensis]
MLHEKLDDFPKNFLWGSASAAYQVEGARNEDGKGPSIWDVFSKIPGNTFQGTNGDVAVDHYHRFKEDVALMAEMGLKAYRFSTSWTRIYPEGKGTVNEIGLQFYDDLINELLKYNIKPIITLYHWDIPQALQELYGGWESREIIEDFNNYCITLYKRFGDRVKYWVTLNEQNIFIGSGYALGTHPPGVKDHKRMYEANHNANLANAMAIQSFRLYVPDGNIGPSFAYNPAYSFTCHPENTLSSENAEEFESHWWLDVYCLGKYPSIAWKYLSKHNLAPTILDGDMELLADGTPDFVGFNYYRTNTYEINPLDGVGAAQKNTTGKKGQSREGGIPGLFKTKRNPQLETTNWDWEIDPIGLRVGLRRITSRYGLPILITENGLGEYDKIEENDVINDDYRIDYLRSHLEQCQEAITDGVNLLGYCTWSFTDLLSWKNGYQKRYGFVYVNRDETDEKDLRRIKKKSFYWYKNVIHTNGQKL